MDVQQLTSFYFTPVIKKPQMATYTVLRAPDSCYTIEEPKTLFSSLLSLGHFQVGSFRYRSLIEGLYTL